MQRLEDANKNLLDLPYDILEQIFLLSTVNSLVDFSLSSKTALKTTADFKNRLANPHFLLKIFSSLPPSEIACLIRAYFSPSSSMFADIKKAAQQPANHEAMICYMLITPEVDSLNKVDSYKAMKWLEESDKPHLKIIYKDMMNQNAFFQRKWSDMKFEQEPLFLNVSGKESLLVDLKMKNLSNGLFRHVNFKIPRFNGSKLDRSCFKDSHLDQADFSNANLNHADFRNTSLQFCKFINTNLENVNFVDATIQEGDFTEANLAGARFIPNDDYNDEKKFSERLTFIFDQLKKHKNFAIFRHAISDDILSHVGNHANKERLLKMAYEHPLFSMHRRFAALHDMMNASARFFKRDIAKAPQNTMIETYSQHKLRSRF